MHYYLVITTKQVVKNQDFLTYNSPNELTIGQIVNVPLGKQVVLAVVYKKVVQPNFITKPITSVLSGLILPTALLETIVWLGHYYATSLPVTLASALPQGLTKQRRPQKQTLTPNIEQKLQANSEQLAAIQKITQSNAKITLLHGITGSGKTTVYIELITKALKQGQSAIVIVPEIALTAQLISQFSAHFNDLILLHSGLSEAKRHLNWLDCLKSDTAKVVIGARSALFAPIRNLGLIIIDECHEASLKQDKNPRYLSSRLAAKLADLHHAKLILGSATPNISDYWLIQKTKNDLVELKNPARPTQKPELELIDMTKKSNFQQHRFLSDQLLAGIKHALTQKQQVLLFHNRRGSSNATICRDCGHLELCPNCQIPLILHHDCFYLNCHVCGHKAPVPLTCLNCQSSDIDHTGIGTKLIEREIKHFFPEARLARFDADSDKAQSVDAIYDQLVSGEIDIMIGTQVLTKGLNLPKLYLVGIIQADAGLALPDFVTEERNFQQIAQVVGRVGRDVRSTKIIVQTYRPEHASIKLGLDQNYAEFYQQNIHQRQKLNYPPFCYLLKLKVAYKTEAKAIEQAQIMAQKISKIFPQLTIIGPAPAFYERKGLLYNWQLVIKAKKRSELLEVVSLIPAQHWQYDLDADSLL